MPTTDQATQGRLEAQAAPLPTSRQAPGQQRAVLAILRDKAPKRALTWHEAEQIAEWQAQALLQLSGITAGPVPSEIISGLPRFAVHQDPELPVSGCLQWHDGKWLILLNSAEPTARQRFTMAHEAKHAIDHRYRDLLYRDQPGYTAYALAEHAADHFAACLWMPRTLVKREWYAGHQVPSDLARHFQVSLPAITRRLQALGLLEVTNTVDSSYPERQSDVRR